MVQENLQPEKHSAPRFKLGYRPELDGLRGIAILLVLGGHAGLLPGSFGFFGVPLFFVLSGFLITCILDEEWKRSGDVSLKAFYMRRALRLLPALVALVVVVVLYKRITRDRGSAADALEDGLMALFYFTNWARAFDFDHFGSFMHTWSLSVEEQFYFVWPLILLLMLRRTRPRFMLVFVMLGVFSSCLARMVLMARYTTNLRVYHGTDTRADGLLLGCAVAILLCHGLIELTPKTVRRLNWAALCSLGTLLAIGFFLKEVDTKGMIRFGWFVINLCGAVLIARLVADRNGFLARVFRNPGLVYIGKISYSLYLWHFPVFLAVGAYRESPLNSALVSIPISILLTLASYHLIEMPCLQLKRKFERRTPGELLREEVSPGGHGVFSTGSAQFGA